eukprot:g78567.t1
MSESGSTLEEGKSTSQAAAKSESETAEKTSHGEPQSEEGGGAAEKSESPAKSHTPHWTPPFETVCEWIDSLISFARFKEKFEFTDWDALKKFSAKDLQDIGIPKNASVPLMKKITALWPKTTPLSMQVAKVQAKAAISNKRLAPPPGVSSKKQKVKQAKPPPTPPTAVAKQQQVPGHPNQMPGVQPNVRVDRRGARVVREHGLQPPTCALQGVSSCQKEAGQCERGDACRFSHRFGGIDPRLCHQWSSGNCRFGDNCKFIHAHEVPPGTPPLPGMRVNSKSHTTSNQRQNSGRRGSREMGGSSRDMGGRDMNNNMNSINNNMNNMNNNMSNMNNGPSDLMGLGNSGYSYNSPAPPPPTNQYSGWSQPSQPAWGGTSTPGGPAPASSSGYGVSNPAWTPAPSGTPSSYGSSPTGYGSSSSSSSGGGGGGQYGSLQSSYGGQAAPYSGNAPLAAPYLGAAAPPSSYSQPAFSSGAQGAISSSYTQAYVSNPATPTAIPYYAANGQSVGGGYGSMSTGGYTPQPPSQAPPPQQQQQQQQQNQGSIKCRNFQAKSTCNYGDNCRFSHDY